MSAYLVTAPARRDLEEIDDYIRADRPAAADRLLASLEATFALLAENPAAGRPRGELRPGVRSFAVGAYVIFYRQVDDVIEILRVLHGRRDLDRAFQ